jgi:DNA processing protein
MMNDFACVEAGSATTAPVEVASPAGADAGAATAPAVADREARFLLSLALRATDAWLGRLLELHRPFEVLTAIREDRLSSLLSLADSGGRAALREREALADLARRYRSRLEWCEPEQASHAAESVGARFVVPGDPLWPRAFDDLGTQRPVGVWIAGTAVSCLHAPVVGPDSAAVSAVSIVGARACTSYGAYVASVIGTELAENGVPVVSGAALGIDAAAHRGALAAGGPTVAVLACGVDVAYPRAHESLLRGIAEHGVLVTELPPGSRPTRFTFLQRNRLIAALGRATVVVEAARRSGSLVTARQAGELGRAVLAVPGPVTSELSQGSHELVRDGATLVAGAAQVLEACATLTSAGAAERWEVQ